VTVVAATLAGALPLEDCAFATPHESLVCVFPAGAGVVSSLTLTVLGQSSSFAPTGLAYAVPVVTDVSPPELPTDMLGGVSVVLTGRGFGPPALTRFVNVTVWGTACGGTVAVTSTAQATVRSDTELSFVMAATARHVVSSWLLAVTVAGQAVAGGARVVPTRRPVISGLSLAAPPFNGTHYFIVLQGSDFGPTVGTTACVGDAHVTVDGSACAALSMSEVWFGAWVRVCWSFVCACAFACALRPLVCLRGCRCPPLGALPAPRMQCARIVCAASQAHSRLTCATAATVGVLQLTTASGSAATPYSTQDLLQPPRVTSVLPVLWDPAVGATLEILGERCVLAFSRSGCEHCLASVGGNVCMVPLVKYAAVFLRVVQQLFCSSIHTSSAPFPVFFTQRSAAQRSAAQPAASFVLPSPLAPVHAMLPTPAGSAPCQSQ
jgi:hypothetical protein